MRTSNRFFATAIDDGSTVSAVLFCEKTLSQMWNEQTNACVPDWEVAANSPYIFSSIRLNGVEHEIVADSDKWYYNGMLLTFDAQGLSTNTGFVGTFKKEPYNWGNDLYAPGLKIVKNLATANADNDVITLEGSVRVSSDVNDPALDFSTSIPVRLSKMSGSGYYGYIDGDSYISSGTPNTTGYSATMKANLFNGDSAVAAANYSTKWFREGVDDAAHPFATTTRGSAHTVSINASQIVDFVVLRVEYYDASDRKVYTAYWDVDDRQDVEEMFIMHGTNNQNNASLRNGETVIFHIWMARRTSSDVIDNRYTSFKCKLLDSAGNVITTGLPTTPDQDGYIDITVNNEEVRTGLIAAKSGKISVSYNFVKNNGSSITGLIVASGSE